ncbi:MAG: hypothetical protein J6F31_00880 [Oscillospiraceae bacterium]|nr:hypothetical protein [Oscillospiraceae bacterium]
MEQTKDLRTSLRGFLPCGAFLLYTVLFFVTSVFHEPWLDEAQSWLIARDASFHDMVFVLPHYEGHPPFWWLLLSLPAKLGLDYEMSLTVISCAVFAAISFLVIFRSPFPLYVRLLLPLSYHIFYGYGVIARPYGICILAFILMGITYKERDEKPFLYIFANILACSATAFAVVLCGGLALCWCIDLFREYRKDIPSFFRNKRFFALLLLLCFALFELYLFIPYEDTFSYSEDPLTAGAFLHGMYYMLLMLPADALLIGTGMGLGGQVKYSSFLPREYLSMTVVSLAMYFFLFRLLLRKNKAKEFVLPYVLLSAFGAGVYFTVHHEGMVFVFILFVLWICFDSKEDRALKIDGYINRAKADRLGLCLLAGSAALECIWSAVDITADIRGNFYYGREVAAYLKETGLWERNIMTPFYENADSSFLSTNKQETAATVNPYFDKNIFFGLNSGNEGYIIHRNSEEINEKNLAEWKNTVPDVLIGEPDLLTAYGRDSGIGNSDYILINTFPFAQLVKMGGYTTYTSVYLRKDLFKEYPDIQPQNEMDREFISP